MFLNEFTYSESKNLVDFIEKNKILIISDVLKGEGYHKASDWYLTIHKSESDKIRWSLEPVNKVMNALGNGEVKITKRGNLKIGKITLQRRGGKTFTNCANHLQFKINPLDLIKA